MEKFPPLQLLSAEKTLAVQAVSKAGMNWLTCF